MFSGIQHWQVCGSSDSTGMTGLLTQARIAEKMDARTML